jgi:GDSL-like Lipase/Acylhydrolase family
MNAPEAGKSAGTGEAKLPRRDLVILPLLSLFTIACCLAGAEVAARHYFFTDFKDTCLIDPGNTHSKHRANCTTTMKSAEGPWVTNEYNSCGYRTRESCGPKPSGATRIALLGSSVSEGLFVAYDESFATRTATELTRIYDRPVEVQNLARAECGPRCMFDETGAALALKPDLLVYAISPYDIQHLDAASAAGNNAPRSTARAVNPNASDPLYIVRGYIEGSASLKVAQHFLFQNPLIFERTYLHYGDNADYMRTGFSPAWERRLAVFEAIFAEMQQSANKANVPFALFGIPSTAQIVFARDQHLPLGVDPFAFNERLRQIALRHGAHFIDGLNVFKASPDPAKLFYITDGHFNGDGHAIISRTLVEQLTKNDADLLSGGGEPQRRIAVSR